MAEPVAELVLTEPEAVPVAEPEAPFAYGAQISLLTVTVVATSAELQALRRQGVTDAVMAVLPVVHWHLTSVRVQEVEAIAVVKQEREHDGRSEMDTAMAEENRERTAAAVVNFMVNVVGDGYSS